LVKESKELRRQIQARITKLQSEISGLEAKEKDLRQKFEDVERAEKGKMVRSEGGKGGKLGVLVGVAKSRVAELRNTLDKVLDQRDELHDKVEELEAIMMGLKEKWNPNFNDEGAKAAVRAWEDYQAKQTEAKHADLTEDEISQILKEDSAESGIDWKEFEEEDPTDTDIRKLSGGR
jgi:protein kinase C substrate 80K-H